MQIARTFYNQRAELMAPLASEVKSAPAIPGEPATEDVGFYHTHKIEAQTPSQLSSLIKDFQRTTGAIEGFMVLSTREYTFKVGTFIRYGLELVYVIEDLEEARIRTKSAYYARPYIATRTGVISR